MVAIEPMEAQLVLHEGCRLQAYLDTEENWTLGVGYNVTSRGLDMFERTIGRQIVWLTTQPIINRSEAMLMLRADIVRVESAVKVHWPYYLKLDSVRQRVAIDMAFNMGLMALGFKNAIAAVEAKDWSRAARELYKSKWSRQVGDGEGKRFDRCDRLAGMLLTGNAPTDIPSV